MVDPIVLLEDPSPNGNGIAVVEQDDRMAFFYLTTEVSGERTTRTCWIRNLKSAPDQLDVEAMRSGLPPMMPKAHCAHPNGAPALVGNDLRIVWSEEGDAAAVYELDELLAVIPCWSGTDGFDGYARDCVGDGPLAWELGTASTNVSFERYIRAAEYWQSWDKANFWPDYRDTLLNQIEGSLGQHYRYFAIDGGQWPPKALAWFNRDAHAILATVGVSMRSQPSVEMHFENASPYRRIELGVCLESSIGDEAVERVASYVSAQSGFPWNNNTWIGQGHTMPADVFEELSSGRLPFVLFTRRIPVLLELMLLNFRGDPVSMLWMIPISERERQMAIELGSEHLLQLLYAQHSDDLFSMKRSEIVA